MPKPRKHRVVLYIKDSDRAIGIIDRLWAVGELTSEQRVAMVSKIDEKRIAIEKEKKQKLENLLARASASEAQADTNLRAGKYAERNINRASASEAQADTNLRAGKYAERNINRQVQAKRKPIQICAQANMPSETLTAYFRQFYKNTGTNTKKRKGCHVEQR